MSNPNITTTFTYGDTLTYTDVNFTSLAPINFNLSVDSPGEYFLGPGGLMTNSTTSPFTSFYGYVFEAPAGSAPNFVSFTPSGQFFSLITLLPDPASIILSGPPGLATGQSTTAYLGFDITGTGAQSFQIILSPVALAVPEPSTLVLSGIAAIVALGVWAGLRSTNCKAKCGPPRMLVRRSVPQPPFSLQSTIPAMHRISHN